MIKSVLKKREKSNLEYVDNMMNNLERIYSNKSRDEYKCCGDISKSPQYDDIQYNVSTLTSIKGYPASDATALKNLFNSLHRPYFHKMVSEYLVKPNERNVIFTTAFTCGYRLLIGELTRIKASTTATEKGLIYKPDFVSRKESVMPMVRFLGNDVEKRLDKMIMDAYKDRDLHIDKQQEKVHQEASVIEEINALSTSFVGVVESVFGFIGNIFKSAASLNPVALMSAILTKSYDKKVQKYSEVSALYETTKKMYDEYSKLPPAQRKKRIEHKYIKMMEKYNIKMNNLKANIDHFDMRAQAEAEHKNAKLSMKETNTTSTGSSSTNTTQKTTENDDTNKSTSDPDFDF